MKEKVEKSTIADESGTVDHVTERNELLEPVAEGLSKDFQGISIPAVLGRLTAHEQVGHDYSYPYAYFEYKSSESGFHFPITPNKASEWACIIASAMSLSHQPYR
jgi:hypothetical protein